ncbi:hypothetical protein [Ferruginibacter sp.]|nr:hypothetical protein [Ferruginibacter sp.]
MKKLFFFVTLLFALSANAKIWRVNNNAGVTADFTQLTTAVASASVLSGDTIHVEPSATSYTFPTITKNLVIIGNGYFLSGATGNAGLQANTETSKVGGFRFASGSAGTRIIGIEITNNSDFASGYSGIVNITIEKCAFTVGFFSFNAAATYDGITVRKCILQGFNSGAIGTLNNVTIENCISNNINVFYLTPAAASNFVVRNNTFKVTGDIRFNNAYFANNIIISGSNNSFTSCNIKNNLFSFNQTGVTTGPLSTNGNNLVSQTEASMVLVTGSNDGRYQLAVASPAIGGGVDISGDKPNCGAFGGNDPYKLSGIPAIPSIYSITVPASVPLATPTMNVTFSTRNNN